MVTVNLNIYCRPSNFALKFVTVIVKDAYAVTRVLSPKPCEACSRRYANAESSNCYSLIVAPNASLMSRVQVLYNCPPLCPFALVCNACEIYSAQPF